MFDCLVNDLVYLVLEFFILVGIGLWLNLVVGSWNICEGSRNIANKDKQNSPADAEANISDSQAGAQKMWMSMMRYLVRF